MNTSLLLTKYVGSCMVLGARNILSIFPVNTLAIDTATIQIEGKNYECQRKKNVFLSIENTFDNRALSDFFLKVTNTAYCW